MTKWQDNYHTYMSLRKKWNERGFRFGLAGMIRNTRDAAQQKCEVARNHGLETPSEQDLELLDEVRTATEVGWEQRCPLDDVYCAALRWLRLPHIHPPRGQPTRVWRGQRKTPLEWPFQAKLFRPDNITKMEEHLKKLGALSVELKRHNSELREDQCFAIATHYSSEAELATWLLDFTANPWVALFFASYKGCEDDKWAGRC